MREIKFRAWDNRGKRMIYFSYFRDFVSWLYNWYKPKRYTLFEYTSLKDKNGKEIYEGDILRSCHKSGDTYQIEWCGESGAYHMRGISTDWHMFYFSDKKLEIYSDDFEIIGNIYENPELSNTVESGT